jgi:tetratricopeptide (TPR) repeat protein
MGNGDEPQTWPLIRKVELRGPWSVLSTGAVLVDLPGFRDSNAARAKVAERYLQNCNQIAIVAPELLGEQFKRRLLMDGQYGNVFFTTETMRDHEDVAQRVPGRWERMSKLSSSLIELEKELNDRLLEEEDLDFQVQEARQQYDEAKADLDEVLKDNDDNSDIEIDEGLLQNLRNVVATNKAALKEAEQALTDFRKENLKSIQSDQEKCSRMQKELKTLCAAVHNKYSRSCLQDDFRSGLKELYRKDDDADSGNDDSNDNIALQDDFNMDVFCISANDYLKLMKIKPSRDGPPNTFFNPADTQIPQLRAFVHDITSRFW